MEFDGPENGRIFVSDDIESWAAYSCIGWIEQVAPEGYWHFFAAAGGAPMTCRMLKDISKKVSELNRQLRRNNED